VIARGRVRISVGPGLWVCWELNRMSDYDRMHMTKVIRKIWQPACTIIGLLLLIAILDQAELIHPVHRPPPNGFPRNIGFVTRSGTHLLLNGHPFRFAGANLHWLALDDSTNYPSQFRVNDALDAAQEIGLTVIRSHDVGISTGCPNCIEPSLHVFNETALEHVDYVIKAAADRGWFLRNLADAKRDRIEVTVFFILLGLLKRRDGPFCTQSTSG